VPPTERTETMRNVSVIWMRVRQYRGDSREEQAKQTVDRLGERYLAIEYITGRCRRRARFTKEDI